MIIIFVNIILHLLPLKIGQGTYSSVFRAREIDTGKIVALKKVRFNNYEPESVRFMAREIQILRRFDHPNIVKLEGLITSRLSCSIYLVFEYMEHDLAGLTSCPDIQFSESQVCLPNIQFQPVFYVAFKVSFFWLSCQKWFPSSCSSKNFMFICHFCR